MVGIKIAEGNYNSGMRHGVSDFDGYLGFLYPIRQDSDLRFHTDSSDDMEVYMGRTLSKSGKRKKTKGFDPKRAYLNEAVKDYLQRGGKITKIIDVADDYDQVGRFPDEYPL